MGESGQLSSSNSVYHLIHDLHETITKSIDTALSWDQLNSPPINYTLVRPIVDRIVHGTRSNSAREDPPEGSSQGESEDEDRAPTASDILSVSGAELGLRPGPSKGKGRSVAAPGGILFALMTNRLQFFNLATGDLSSAALQSSRATFCELLAIKILRATFEEGEEAEYVGELVRAYCSYDGAPESVMRALDEDKEELEESRTTALELAIVSKAKRFLSQPLIQHLNNRVYRGTLVYSPRRSSSFISDSYVSTRPYGRSPRASPRLSASSGPVGASTSDELTEVYVYDPYEAGWLDHRRLRVPKWRKWLELLEFAVLLGLFIATLTSKRFDRPNAIEIVNFVYTLGFILDEFAASREHGWEVYMTNAWNAFDMTYIAVYTLYLVLRFFGLFSKSMPTSELAFDVLAIGACILFPRLMLFFIKDNVVILALKAMIARFIGFMGIVIVAFSGICFCLWTLGRGTWTIKQITWLMLQIWFGSSYLGFSASESFHPLFGPIILISYAALCNTLLITILISILSNQFAEINANAQEEHLFQRVVKTVEGVKSDFVFSYLPPFNLLALAILGPMSKCCDPKTLHRVNVFAIRCTSFPILLAISAYERWSYRSRGIHLQDKAHIQRPSFFDTFLGPSSEDQLLSVFDWPLLRPVGSSVIKPGGNGSQGKARDTADHGVAGKPHGASASIDSPLARLFAPMFGESEQSKASDSGAQAQGVRDELGELKASQLRIEELLAQLMAGTSKGQI